MATAIRSGVANCRWPTRENVEATVREARSALADARDAANDFAVDAKREVRRRPLRAIGIALFAGAIVGSFVGFGAGRFTRT